MGADFHQKESLCFMSVNEQHDSTPLRKTSLRLVAYLGKYICIYIYFSNLLKTNYGRPVLLELAFCGLPPQSTSYMEISKSITESIACA